MSIQKDPVKSKFCKLRLLCRSLAGNNVYYLTVTAPVADEEAMRVSELEVFVFILFINYNYIVGINKKLNKKQFFFNFF